jgi:hypothetical protein
MIHQLKFKTLFWVNSLANRLERKTSTMLEKLEHFTRDDIRDELLNRYPA